MNDVDVGWLAGIIDGEGSISLERKNKGEWKYPRLSVSSTDIEILQHCVAITGIGTIRPTGIGTIRPKKEVRSNYKPSWVWKVDSKNDTLGILSVVLPYLKCPKKKNRSILLFQDYERLTFPGGNYTEEQKEEKRKFQATFLKL